MNFTDLHFIANPGQSTFHAQLSFPGGYGAVVSLTVSGNLLMYATDREGKPTTEPGDFAGKIMSEEAVMSGLAFIESFDREFATWKNLEKPFGDV